MLHESYEVLYEVCLLLILSSDAPLQTLLPFQIIPNTSKLLNTKNTRPPWTHKHQQKKKDWSNFGVDSTFLLNSLLDSILLDSLIEPYHPKKLSCIARSLDRGVTSSVACRNFTDSWVELPKICEWYDWTWLHQRVLLFDYMAIHGVNKTLCWWSWGKYSYSSSPTKIKFFQAIWVASFERTLPINNQHFQVPCMSMPNFPGCMYCKNLILFGDASINALSFHFCRVTHYALILMLRTTSDETKIWDVIYRRVF